VHLCNDRQASVEKSRYLKALGAERRDYPVSAKPGTPDHYFNGARIAAENAELVYPDQYSHPANRKHTIARLGRSFGSKTEAGSRTLFRIGTVEQSRHRKIPEREESKHQKSSAPIHSDRLQDSQRDGKVPETTPYLVEGIARRFCRPTRICNT